MASPYWVGVIDGTELLSVNEAQVFSHGDPRPKHYLYDRKFLEPVGGSRLWVLHRVMQLIPSQEVPSPQG